MANRVKLSNKIYHMGRVFFPGGGGLIPSDSWGMPPGKFFKLGALKLHFQHSQNTFGEIFHVFKTTFYWCFCDSNEYMANLLELPMNTNNLSVVFFLQHQGFQG